MFKQNLINNFFQIFCIKQVDQASNVVDFGFKKSFPYNINSVCTCIHNNVFIYIILFSCKQFVFIRERYNHLSINYIIFFEEQVKKCKDNNENESLLKDAGPPIDENDRQLHQASVNISKQNQMQITRTEMLSETAKRETRSKLIQKDEKQNKESEQNAAAIDVIQKDNPEIDDDKLRQFLSKGEITVCHVRCIIVGCGKAGKTTLLKRLQNVSFDELMQIERTEMEDSHSFEVLLEEETIQSKKIISFFYIKLFI